MASTNYSLKKFDEHMARANGKELPISTKAAMSICDIIRGMDAHKAVTYMQDVVNKKRAVPFNRFPNGVGHRKGKMASGRYPVKAAKTIGNLVASAMANASTQGLSDSLTIIHISAHKAADQPRQGRHLSRSMKRTHVEVVLRENETEAASSEKAKKKSKKSATKSTTGSSDKSSGKISKKVSENSSQKSSQGTSQGQSQKDSSQQEQSQQEPSKQDSSQKGSSQESQESSQKSGGTTDDSAADDSQSDKKNEVSQ